MNTTMTHLDGQAWYTLFHQIAILGGFLIFSWIGMKRRYAIHNWLLIGASAFVCMTIGMHVATLTIADWQIFFTNGSFPMHTGKTTIGAAIGFAIGAWMSQRLLRTKYPVVDILAFVIPAALIFQRIGCLFAGCCFGKPTESILGIRYASHFPVYQYQYAEGLISADGASSLPVHPVPVYFMILGMITLALVFFFRKRMEPGPLFTFSISLILAGRFIIEFFRDPVTNHQLGGLWLGLKEIQWVLLAGLLVIGLFLFFRKRNLNTKRMIVKDEGMTRQVILTIFLLLILLPFNSLFDKAQVQILVVIFGLLAAAQFFVIISHKYYVRPEFALTMVPVFLVFCMSQQGSPDKKQKPYKIFSYDEHEVAFSPGSYIGEESFYNVTRTVDDVGCMHTDYDLIKKEVYQGKGSFGYRYANSRVMSNGAIRNHEVLANYAGVEKKTYSYEGSGPPSLIGTEQVPGFSIGYQYGSDRKNIGYRAGFLIGKMYQSYIDPNASRGPQEIPFLPTGRFTVGSYQKRYIEATLGDQSPLGFNRYVGKLRTGINLAMSNLNRNPQVISIGITDQPQICLEGDFSISERLSIRPAVMFYLGDTDEYLRTPDGKEISFYDPVFSIRIAYRTNFSRKKQTEALFHSIKRNKEKRTK